ncbi:MAG: hypothetical protein U1F98_14770 [Verrucomicrobiota bacterium]
MNLFNLLTVQLFISDMKLAGNFTKRRLKAFIAGFVIYCGLWAVTDWKGSQQVGIVGCQARHISFAVAGVVSAFTPRRHDYAGRWPERELGANLSHAP